MGLLQFVAVLLSTPAPKFFFPNLQERKGSYCVTWAHFSLGDRDLSLGSKEVDSMREMYYRLSDW